MKLPRRRPYDIRNRAIILVGFAAGWRRSELSSLNLSDVGFAEQGMTLRLKKSKTDQQGAGRLTGIHYGRRRLTCPVRALKEWLAIRGHWQGPLFCAIEQSGRMRRSHLSDETICGIIQKSLAAIGENSKRYGAHSLRAGMVTTAIEDGASESLIMQRTGHRSYASLKPYIRPAKAFFGNPLAKAL
jgi:integrase